MISQLWTFLVIIALCAPVFAQDIVRSTPNQIRITFANHPHHAENVIVISNAGQNRLPFDETKGNSISETATSLLLTLTQDQIAAIREDTQRGYTPRLSIGRLCVGGVSTIRCSDDDAAIDTLYEIPDALAAVASGPVKNRQILLHPTALPSECITPGFRDKSNWTVTAGNLIQTIEEDIRVTVGPPAGVLIILKAQPRNRSKVAVSYVPTDPALKAVCTLRAKVANLDAPVGTKEDPTGGGDIYAAFTYTRNVADETTDVFSTDAFFRYRLWSHVMSKNVVAEFDPSITVKTATKPQDDENSFAAELPITFALLVTEPRWFAESAEISPAFKFESDKKGATKNAVLDLPVTLYPQDWRVGSKSYIRFWPLVGTEYGKNISNESATLDGKTILRLKTGGNLSWQFEINKPYLQAITLEASFVYRKLFEEELRVDQDKQKLKAGVYIGPDGTPVTLSDGTFTFNRVFNTSQGPRRYWDVAARVALTPNLLMLTEYTYGALPPAFEHVDKLTTGIAFRFNFLGR